MYTMLDLIPCVMGLPVINEGLQELIQAMSNFQGDVGLGVIQGYAKMIGLCIALGVGANECYQMMLGRRGLDVMKLLHIVIISMCITFAGIIADMAAEPGKQLESVAYALANNTNESVKAKEEEVAKLQEEYLEGVRTHLIKLQEHEKAEDAAKGEGWGQKLFDATGIPDAIDGLNNWIKEKALLAEMQVCEWISLLVRFLGEVLFQVAYYGLLVAQNIFMHILAAFAPLMFAMSLSPHYKSAWSQWLSKYISLSLWGFVVYVCLHYIDYIIVFNLDKDIESYKLFMADLEKDTSGDVQIGAIGMQAVGSTCMYVVSLLVGVRVLAFVPEVASWLIPGGVSSGAGSMASAGSSVGGAAAGVAAASAPFAAKVAGSVAGGTSVLGGVVQNSSIGMAYDAGRTRSKSGRKQ